MIRHIGFMKTHADPVESDNVGRGRYHEEVRQKRSLLVRQWKEI